MPTLHLPRPEGLAKTYSRACPVGYSWRTALEFAVVVLAWWIGSVQAATLDFLWGGGDESALEVGLVDGTSRRLLERFPAPRIILESAVSSDASFAAVIWQTLDAEPKVTVYATESAKIVGAFASPAYRPTEVWFSANNNLVIQGTCGTSCAVFDLMDRTGKSLLPRDFLGGLAYEIAPGGRMAVSYPNPYTPEEASGASVFSLEDGHVIASVTLDVLGDRTVGEIMWTATGARLTLDGPGGRSALDLVPAAPVPPVVSAYPAEDSASELRVTAGGKTRTFVSYRALVRVTDVSVSRDAQYVVATTQALGVAPSSVVYELSSGKQIGTVDTDGRATMTWSSKGTLVVEGSCGTDCHTVQVVGVDGKVLGKPLAGGVTATSPSGAYLLFYPNEGSHPVPVSLIDLSTGGVAAEFPGTTSGQLRGGEVTWSADGTVAVLAVRDVAGPERQLRVAADGTCSWVTRP